MVNIIEIKYLRNGYFKEKTKVVSEVVMKQGESVKQYLRRIIEDGNITDAFVTKTKLLRDIGSKA